MSNLDSFLREDDCASRVVHRECTTALSPSRLPGLKFALNPYTRCGHGCTYCYAPYIMRVPPTEWDRDIIAKVNIPKVLAKELPRKKGVIGLGTVTDPYQPVERKLLLTRRCLEEMAKVPSRVSVLTKSDLVYRDADVLKKIAGAEVGITINTISDDLAAVLERCAPPPSRRLKTATALIGEGLSTYVFLGPVVPTITDHDLEGLVMAIAGTGVRSVMVDRLNLRPGMRNRMVGAMRECSPSNAARFDSLVEDSSYYARTVAELRRLLSEAGLTVTDAF